MRFGLLTQWYDPEPGPAGLPGALARGLVARGHEIEVVTGFPNYPSGVVADGFRLQPRTVEQRDGIRVTRVALYPSHGDSISSRLANYGTFAASAAVLGVPPAFHHVDALWVNYSPVTIALPMFVQRVLRRTPALVHVLDLWPDTLTATGFAGGGLVGRTALRGVDALCRAMYRSAEKVAFISPGVGDLLAKRGVEQHKLAYAPMWANEDVSIPGASGRGRGFSLEDNQIALVYAGTLGRAQGLESLITACAETQDLNVVCLIAGSGTEAGRLKALAEERGAGNVRFLGRLPQAMMSSLMAASDLNYVALNTDPLAAVTMPSKMQATLAAARPILGSVTGDAARVVQESGGGWAVPPGDVAALAATLRLVDSAGRASLSMRGVAARDYYDREFSYRRGVDRIEDLLIEASQNAQRR